MQEVSGRILGLDIGDKKIGVALTDPFGQTAQPLVTLPRHSFASDCAELFKLLKEYRVKKIIFGLPIDLQGREGPQAKKVRFFIDGFEKFLAQQRYEAALEPWDESYSSQEAEKILLEADMSRKKRRKVIDKLAAVMILQSYLDEKKC